MRRLGVQFRTAERRAHLILAVLVWIGSTAAIGQSGEDLREHLRPAFVIDEWDCTDGQDHCFLANPAAISIDDSGEIYVLDAGNDRVAVFSHSGEFLRAIGRAGEGPGEFSFRMFMPDLDIEVSGDLVYVNDPRQHRVHIFDRQGQLKTTFTAPQNVTSLSASGERLYLGLSGNMAEDRHEILQFDSSGTQISSFSPSLFTDDSGRPGIANANKLAAGGGRIIQVYHLWSLIRAHEPGETPEPIILDADWWTVPRLREEAEDLRAQLESALAGKDLGGRPGRPFLEKGRRPFFDDIEYITGTGQWIALSNYSTAHIMRFDGTLERSIALDPKEGNERFSIMSIGVDARGQMVCAACPNRRSAVACYLLDQKE